MSEWNIVSQLSHKYIQPVSADVLQDRKKQPNLLQNLLKWLCPEIAFSKIYANYIQSKKEIICQKSFY